VSELNTEPALAIEQIFRVQRLDAMATSFDWAVLREIDDQGGWSQTIWDLATATATDTTVDGGVPDLPVARQYSAALSCHGVDGVST
jgi:hypothetical protein